MELKKYYKFFLRSYFVSYFFFFNFSEIIFIKNLKINILVSFNKSYRFIFFIIFSLIFNTDVCFNIYNYKYIMLEFTNLFIYLVSQFFSLVFLPMNFFNFFFIFKNSEYCSSFVILNFFFVYIIDLFYDKFNLNKFFNCVYFFFFNNYEYLMRFIFFRFFLFPVIY